MLARFTQIGCNRDMAFIATLDEKGGEREIGVARYRMATRANLRSRSPTNGGPAAPPPKARRCGAYR